MVKKDYEDIPGTYVFDADRARVGYPLNQFCISLGKQEGRDAFKADPEGYMSDFDMTEEQKQTVRDRDWNGMFEVGGNVYYTAKLAANDGLSFQQLAALMTGMGHEAYRDMMLHGGRSIEGNRYKSEWGEE